MRFLLRRLALYLVAAWASLTLAFVIPRLMPGDPETVIASPIVQEAYLGSMPAAESKGAVVS